MLEYVHLIFLKKLNFLYTSFQKVYGCNKLISNPIISLLFSVISVEDKVPLNCNNTLMTEST